MSRYVFWRVTLHVPHCLDERYVLPSATAAAAAVASAS